MFWQVEPQKVHQAEGKPWLRNSTWTFRWHLFLRTLQRSEANKTAKSRVHRLQWFAISVWFTYLNSNHFKPPWLVSGISQSPCEAWQDPGFGQVKSPNVAFCPNGTLRTTRTPRASRNGMVVQYCTCHGRLVNRSRWCYCGVVDPRSYEHLWTIEKNNGKKHGLSSV